jgi:hypothetical protein
LPCLHLFHMSCIGRLKQIRFDLKKWKLIWIFFKIHGY